MSLSLSLSLSLYTYTNIYLPISLSICLSICIYCIYCTSSECLNRAWAMNWTSISTWKTDLTAALGKQNIQRVWKEKMRSNLHTFMFKCLWHHKLRNRYKKNKCVNHDRVAFSVFLNVLSYKFFIIRNFILSLNLPLFVFVKHTRVHIRKALKVSMQSLSVVSPSQVFSITPIIMNNEEASRLGP